MSEEEVIAINHDQPGILAIDIGDRIYGQVMTTLHSLSLSRVSFNHYQELKREKISNKKSKLRRVKYPNNRAEQDYREVKKITDASLGDQSLRTAWRTIKWSDVNK
ncbi:MAG: hypothetical protein AAGF26_15285, partial [Cyanobacteria bacterium P01_G01_bin.49]